MHLNILSLSAILFLFTTAITADQRKEEIKQAAKIKRSFASRKSLLRAMHQRREAIPPNVFPSINSQDYPRPLDSQVDSRSLDYASLLQKYAYASNPGIPAYYPVRPANAGYYLSSSGTYYPSVSNVYFPVSSTNIATNSPYTYPPVPSNFVYSPMPSVYPTIVSPQMIQPETPPRLPIPEDSTPPLPAIPKEGPAPALPTIPKEEPTPLPIPVISKEEDEEEVKKKKKDDEEDEDEPDEEDFDAEDLVEK